MKWLGSWIAESRLGRNLFRFGAVGLATVLAIAIALFIRQHDVNQITQRINVIETEDPCMELSRAVKGREPAKSVRPLASQCTTFLNGLGPQVSLKLSCAILREGGYPCPKPGSEHGGVMHQTPSHSGQQPSPGKGHRGGHHHGTSGETSKPPKSRKPHHSAPPAPPPTDTPTPTPAPAPPAPGNSGNTPGGDQGHKTCVHLIVSACLGLGTNHEGER